MIDLVRLVYRNYKAGDDEQLADLYNRAFQMAGFNFLRNGKNWNWRYFQSPNFEDRMIHLLEDVDNRKIVGAVCANPIELLSFGDKKYLVGDINDVICHPSYTKKGIAKNLMKKALDYLKEKGCDISMLAADEENFPREKIYSKFGFFDIEKAHIYLNFANIFMAVKNFPAFAYLLLVLFMNSYIPRFIYKLKIQFKPFLKDIAYEITYNEKHFEYRNAANKILKKNYIGFPDFDKRKIKWSRIKVPSKNFIPTYIIIRKNNQIIGCATLIHKDMYYLKFGIKIKIGFVNELLIDKSCFTNSLTLYYGYIFFLDKILKAANRRFVGVCVILANSKEKEFVKALKALRFLKFSNTSIMMKRIKNNLPDLNFNKTLYLPSYLMLGSP